MVGTIHTSVVPYYDIKTNSMRTKSRPVLVIGDERNNDYTVLPISTISIKSNMDCDFDIEVKPSNYPLLKLNKTSYIRTHKQCTVHKGNMVKMIADLKVNYPDLFLEVMAKLEQWNQKISDESI